MATATLTRTWTVDEAKALDDDVGHELIDGALLQRATGAWSSAISVQVGWLIQKYDSRPRRLCVMTASVALHLFPDRTQYFRRAEVCVVLRTRFAG